jgi:uncharacterized protein GlcG (DUF336 family)
MLNIKRLSQAEAKIMLAAAEKKATETGVPQVIAVTDESGNLLAFSRMDGGKVSSVKIAIDKAFTAAAARNPTEHYNKLCQPGQPTFGIHVTNDGHFCIIGGGLPVVVDGQVVGGIGVSSGTPVQDIAVAQAGVDAVLAEIAKSKG